MTAPESAERQGPPAPGSRPPVHGHQAGEVRRCVFQGFGYSCRIVRQPGPRLDPVLIVGAAFQTKDSWHLHERYFGSLADLVTVDLPGWGDADRLPARYGFDFLAGALEHLMDVAGLARVNLVGVSYGSLVASCLARRCPQRIARMVLCGAFDGVAEHARISCERTIDLIRTGRTCEFTELMVSLLSPRGTSAHPGREEAIAQLVRSQFGGMTEGLAEQYLENAARVLAHPRLRPGGHRVPTLVLAGENDVCTPPEWGRRVASGIPGSVFATVRDAGHLVFLEYPREFVEVLGDFFSGRPPGGLTLRTG